MKKINIIFLFIVLIAQTAFGKKYSDEKSLSNGSIIVTSMPAVTCESYSNLKVGGTGTEATSAENRGFMLQNPYAIVRLTIPNTPGFQSLGTATVKARVRYEYEMTGQILEDFKDVELTVGAVNGKFKDIAYAKIDGALKAVVEITQVDHIGVFAGIKISASCEGDIFKFLPPHAMVSGLHYASPNLRSDGSLADGNLHVSWDNKLLDGNDNTKELVNAGVESYELEWTYISDQGSEEGTTLNNNEIKIRENIFRTNSSRIETFNNGFFIPLIYEKGLIVFRVRPIGKNVVDGMLTDVKGKWSVAENTTSLTGVPSAYIYKFPGLEKNLNWQSSISFAEEGKNKVVVSYHDGSMRNRQAVTRINTDDRTVIGETFYDYNGRPVIQTLPVPIPGQQENNLNFRPELNLIDQKGTISKTDYDRATQGQSCVPLAPKFSTESGSSRYYSGNNGFFGTGGNTGENILNKDYIPDAKKYPYTQTFYTGDNTGRISAQSGVGENHILSSGHETKYMYGAPLQSEISRLFGNQVGINGHYKKNSVIDPNGQVSVSYLDLDGKVIATALAGGNDTGLDNLPGEKTRNISSNLITDANNELDSDGKGKTTIFPFPVTTKVAYTFNYDMTAGVHTVKCKGLTNPTPIEVKMAGVFDATISLYGKCNTLIFTASASNTEAFGSDITTPAKVPISKTVPADLMEVGQYTLVKKIRLNQAKLDNYLDKYLKNDQYTCVLKDDYFMAHALDSIDFSSCEMTCSQCKDSISSLVTKVRGRGIDVSPEEVANLYERCESICLKNTTCLSSLYNMLASMSPDGQYGQVRKNPTGTSNNNQLDMNNISDELDINKNDIQLGTSDGEPTISSDNALVPEQFPLSIYNENNILMPNQFLKSGGMTFYRADWRRPIHVNISGNNNVNFKNQIIFTENLASATYIDTINYRNEDGTIAYAYIQKTGENTYFPEVMSNAPVILAEDDVEPNLYKVPLKYLKDVKVFISKWQSHFANYLVPYHPEFSYYVECSTRITINEYEEKLIDANSPGDALTSKLLVADVSGGVNYLVPSIMYGTSTDADPIFTDASIPQNMRDSFKNKINNYRSKLNSDGTPVSPAVFYTMAQAATMLVNCPNGTDADCKNPNCDNGKFKSDDVEEWVSFKTLYLTERQKILREVSTKKAIEGKYYNGCIGNASFRGSQEEKRMLTRYASVPELDNLIAYRNSVCNGSVPFPYNSIPFGKSVFYGRRWKRYCENLNNLVNSEATLMRFNAIPLYDPNQMCNIDKAGNYANNIRAFYGPLPTESTIGGNGETCYEIITDQDGVARYLKTECNMAILDQGALMENSAKIRSFSSCGNCPVVSQIQDLFTEITENEGLDKTLQNFNCFTNTPNFGIGKEISSFISNSLSVNTLLSWDGQYDLTTKRLTGTITPTPLSGNNPLIFKLEFANSGIPNLGNEQKFSQVFKKIKIAGIVTDNSAQSNKFRLKAYITLNRALPDYTTTESLLTGSQTGNYVPNNSSTIYKYVFDIPVTIFRTISGQEVAVKIDTCSFEPLCSTTQFATNVMGLLNVLTYKDETEVVTTNSTVKVKTYDLLPATSVTVQDADIYDEPVRQLLGLTLVDAAGDYTQKLSDYQMNWTASQSGANLQGHLNFKVGTANKSFDITITPEEFANSLLNNVDFTKVSFFANVRPFNVNCTEAKCNSNKFYADAVVKENVGAMANSYVYHRVVIELTTKTGTETDQVKPVSTMCEKISGKE